MKDITKLTLGELLSSENKTVYRNALSIYKELHNPTKMKCDWCKKIAVQKRWREIDGMTTSTRECELCIQMDTDYLLRKYA